MSAPTALDYYEETILWAIAGLIAICKVFQKQEKKVKCPYCDSPVE